MTDVHGMITALYVERERIDHAIGRLETRARALVPRHPQNRGRKIMAPEERLEVSRRMTAYWTARRKEHRDHS